MDNSSAAAAAGLGALIATLGVFSFVIAAVWYVLQVIAYWKIFAKAGKPGWHSIIPILNQWDEVDLSWNRTMAWVFIIVAIAAGILSNSVNNGEASGFMMGALWVLTVAACVIGIINNYKLAKAFGKGIGFFLGLVFLNPIFKLILGFGDAQYQGRQG